MKVLPCFTKGPSLRNSNVNPNKPLSKPKYTHSLIPFQYLLNPSSFAQRDISDFLPPTTEPFIQRRGRLTVEQFTNEESSIRATRSMYKSAHTLANVIHLRTLFGMDPKDKSTPIFSDAFTGVGSSSLPRKVRMKENI